jgi:AcrR family transcriptional regulator
VQERSRERVERILAATEALIIEVGVNNLRINEIAARAQIPAGSIYQYFPDLEAIVHNLVDRYHRHFKKLADTQFLNIRSVGEFTEKHIAMLEDASRFLRETPGYRELWCGAQGWPPLREMDWLDTRYNAERITDALHRLLPNLDRNEILATCMVTLDAARSVVLMALYFEDEYDLIWQQYKSMVISHITSLTRKSLHPPAAP